MKKVLILLFLSIGLCYGTTKTFEIAGYVTNKQLDEASGLAASRNHNNVLYSHNDSGDIARLFALKNDGTILAQYLLKDVRARDFEDIAIGPGPIKDKNYVYLGDIGDNNAVYKDIIIYRFSEPNVPAEPDASATAKGKEPEKLHLISEFDTIKFAYPDGPRDAEGLFVDPLNKDIWIISKRESKSRVYVGRYPYSLKQANKLEFVCELPFNYVTGADISPDGMTILIRSYLLLGQFERGKNQTIAYALGQKPQYVMLMPEPQGEAIAISADGGFYYTLSEYQKKMHKDKGIPLYNFGFKGSSTE